MVTTEIFEKLKALQVILARQFELQKKIKSLPDELIQQQATLDTFKAEYIEKNKKYEEVKSQVLATKLSLEETVKIREQGEVAMDNVTSHRDYELLYKQIEDARLKETDLRKTYEIQGRELAKFDEEVRSVKDLIDPQEKDLSDAKADIEKQITEATAEVAQLEKQKAAITPGLDEDILFKFERIIQRNDEGIVAVKNGVCMGCHMMLPAQFANEVHEGDKIIFCPYCSRILYYEQSDEEGQETYFSDTGSLVDIDDDEDLDEDIDDEDAIDEELPNDDSYSEDDIDDAQEQSAEDADID